MHYRRELSGKKHSTGEQMIPSLLVKAMPLPLCITAYPLADIPCKSLRGKGHPCL